MEDRPRVLSTITPLPGHRLRAEVSGRVLPLALLRRNRKVTQTQLSVALGVSQSEVSRIERHPNLLLSTVHAYVLAMGGELELVVRFGGDERVVLDSGQWTSGSGRRDVEKAR